MTQFNLRIEEKTHGQGEKIVAQTEYDFDLDFDIQNCSAVEREQGPKTWVCGTNAGHTCIYGNCFI